MSGWPVIRFLREQEEISKTRSRLPHWQQEGGCYFITFRLADSLPKQLLDRFKEEREAWIQFHPKPWDDATEREYHERFSATIDRWLDAGHGECRLAVPGAADIVTGAFGFFDGERCLIHASVVMPNHVHLLVSLAPDEDLGELIASWKSFTARQINLRDGRRGELWQRDYFDRLIRDRDHFRNVVRYIRGNADHASNAQLYVAPWVEAVLKQFRREEFEE